MSELFYIGKGNWTSEDPSPPSPPVDLTGLIDVAVELSLTAQSEVWPPLDSTVYISKKRTAVKGSCTFPLITLGAGGFFAASLAYNALPDGATLEVIQVFMIITNQDGSQRVAAFGHIDDLSPFGSSRNIAFQDGLAHQTGSDITLTNSNRWVTSTAGGLFQAALGIEFDYTPAN